MTGKPWFAWEWLYDLVVGALDRIAGLNGVVLFTGFIISLTFAATFRLLLHRGTHICVAVGLVLLAASASMIHFLARPHVVTWFLAVIWFHILDSSETAAEDADSRVGKIMGANLPARIWFLPVSMLLWVNLHGGFLLGVVLIGIYWMSALWQRFVAGSERLEEILRKRRAGLRFRQLTLIAVLSAIVSLFNPYGFRLHVHIYRYLSNRFLMDHIDEFQSPNFHGVAQKCFALLVLLAVVAAARNGRSWRGSELLIVLFAIASGLYAARNIPVASVLLILIVGPRLSRRTETRGYDSHYKMRGQNLRDRFAAFSSRMEKTEFSLHGHLWPLAILTLLCVVAANGGKLGESQIMRAHFDQRRFPVAATQFLERRSMAQPILAPDFWGGFLIYQLYPSAKVVVDDRHDLYGEEFLRSYSKTVRGEPGWEELLQRSNPRLVLLPKTSPLASLLTGASDWKTIYSDEVAVVFARNLSQ